MKNKLTRDELLEQYKKADADTLFSQVTIAAIRQCSVHTIERDRWAGIGVPFIKIGHIVRYRKKDIEAWMAQHRVVQSTTQADAQK